jgi:hypothetical protein
MSTRFVTAVALFACCLSGFAQQEKSPALDEPTRHEASQPRVVRYQTFPLKADPEGLRAHANVATVPTWSGAAGSDNYTILGQNPTTALSNPTTTISAPLIPLVLTFSDGTVFDPTKTSTCSSTAPTSLIQSSPIFTSSAYTVGGTSVGATIYHDFFQRANFWKYTGPTGINPNYHLLLTTSVGTPVNITVPAASGSTTTESCGKMGQVEINFLNNYLLTTAAAQLASNGVLPSQIPIYVLSNVVMYTTTTSDCCTLGFHTAFNNSNYSGALQLYVVTDFDTTGAFGVTTDVSSLSHEMAETINDPEGNNPTPPWGNVGQVTGCQTNLEVGDPLTGTDITLTMSNNYTYHLQELAFASWFFRQSPSIAVNGWYSSNDTFKTYSAVCNPTTTTLTISPATFTVGATATIASKVAPTTSQSTVPTGTVALVSSTGTTIDTYTLNSSGAVSATAANFPAGTYTVTAKYSGDANFNASSSAAVSVTVGAPSVSFSPISLTFASQTTGTSSAAQTVKLSNGGTASLTGIAIALAGASPGDYSQTNTCGTSLAVGANCNISVTFRPTATGSRTATVSVADNATGSPQTVALSGTGAAPAPAASLGATSLNFGSAKVSVATAAQFVTVTNSGTAALAITSVVLGGANPGDFTETTTCTGSIAIGGTCTITATFKPTALGARSATITVTDNASGATQTIALSGTGVTPVTLSASSTAFAGTPVGSAAAAQTLTLTNGGTTAITMTSVAISGANASDFSDTTTCTGTIAPAGTCTVTLTFKPTATGARAATLTLTDSAAGSPQSVALSGTGLASVTLSSTSLALGAVVLSAGSPTQTLTLTNASSTASVALASLAITGTNAAEFTDTTTCGASLAAGGACTVVVTFTPTAIGAASAAITLTAGGVAESVALTGTGASQVSLSATSLAFGSVTLGTTSAAQSVTVTNAGKTAVSISSVSLSGTADFSETTTCGTSLAAGANCTISVTFKPASKAAFSATLTLTDSAVGSPQSVALSGSGR